MNVLHTKLSWLLKQLGPLAMLLVASTCAVGQVTPTPSVTAKTSLEPIVWQQPLLFIPYRVNTNLPAASDIAEVQLLVSRTGNNDWLVLQSAKPNVQGFSYHAPEDGHYWFAVKHLDAKGQPMDGAHVVPQLFLIIDTKPPQLELSATAASGSAIEIRYEASDPNLDLKSILIEGRAQGGLWTNITAGQPDVVEPARLVGVARWQLPPGTNITDAIELRASIADATGQRGQAETTVAVAGGPALMSPVETPSPSVPVDSNIAGARPSSASVDNNPFQSAVSTPQEWPANNQSTGQSAVVNQGVAPTGPPPIINPYVTAKAEPTPRRTPARFAVDGSENVERAELENFAPDLLNGSHAAQNAPMDLPSTGQTDWSSATPADGATQDGALLVNARTFDVEYELASVGPGGVAKVELWGTSDGGNTWQLFGIDPDNSSPARITVPNGGTFGFRIVVEGVNAPGAVPPQSGDKPELVITVDLESPTAEIIAVEPGEGNLADHLRIRWKATDNNLESRPIDLFYSSYPNGPWSTIASGLENTGFYLWRVERHVPGRIYLKLEARDTAGNSAGYQTPELIELYRQQPKGTLRGIRPASERAE